VLALDSRLRAGTIHFFGRAQRAILARKPTQMAIPRPMARHMGHSSTAREAQHVVPAH
jgi:hypothetical protein